MRCVVWCRVLSCGAVGSALWELLAWQLCRETEHVPLASLYDSHLVALSSTTQPPAAICARCTLTNTAQHVAHHPHHPHTTQHTHTHIVFEYACAGVMIGRPALGRPWLFTEAADMLCGRLPTTPPPPLGGVLALALQHLTAWAEWEQDEMYVSWDFCDEILGCSQVFIQRRAIGSGQGGEARQQTMVDLDRHTEFIVSAPLSACCCSSCLLLHLSLLHQTLHTQQQQVCCAQNA